MSNENLKFMLRLEAFQESQEFQIYKKIRRSRLLLYCYRQNYLSLLKCFQEFNDKSDDPQFWTNDSNPSRRLIQIKTTTNILNYLSTATTIIDISRAFAQKEVYDEKDYLWKDYDNLVKTKFVNKQSNVFVRNLRNYILHYDLVDVGVFIKFHHIEGKSKAVYFSRNKILNWSSWTSQSRKFISEQNQEIQIESIFKEYHQDFMTVQDDLFRRIIFKNFHTLKVLSDNMQKLIEENKWNFTMPFRLGTYRYLNYILDKSYEYITNKATDGIE